MRLASAKKIAAAVSRRLGRFPDANDGVDAEQRMSNLAWADGVLGDVWGWSWWPDLMRVRQRTLVEDEHTELPMILNEADDWDAGTAYAVGDEVWYGGLFWVALAASTGSVPVEGETWTEIENYARIGQVRRVVSGGLEMDLKEVAGGWLVDGRGIEVGGTVHVEFRLPKPELCGVVLDRTVAYSRGETRYLEADGNCWRSLRDNNEDHDPLGGALDEDWWEMVEVPAYFVRPLGTLAAAESLFSDDREGEASRLENKGMEALSLLRARLIGRSGPEERARVSVVH